MVKDSSITAAKVHSVLCTCDCHLGTVMAIQLTSSKMKDIFISDRQVNCCSYSLPEAQT